MGRGHRKSISPGAEVVFNPNMNARRQMLSHSKGVITESLTKCVPANEEMAAVHNFTNILYYMVDKPAPNLVRQASFDYILTLAMRAEFCNEVFIQVIKQLTNNDNPRSMQLGWQLLHLICTSVLPCQDLWPYVHSWLTRVINTQDEFLMPQALKCIQALEMRALPVLRGHLFKKKPTTLTLKAWDKRFFVVGNHQLFWWANADDAARPEAARARGGPLCKGVIDFMQEEAHIEPSVGSETQFTIKPRKSSGWSKGFEHASGDLFRIFVFDTAATEWDREHWLGCLQAHIQYADRFRVRSQSTVSMCAPESMIQPQTTQAKSMIQQGSPAKSGIWGVFNRAPQSTPPQ